MCRIIGQSGPALTETTTFSFSIFAYRKNILMFAGKDERNHECREKDQDCHSDSQHEKAPGHELAARTCYARDFSGA